MTKVSLIAILISIAVANIALVAVVAITLNISEFSKPAILSFMYLHGLLTLSVHTCYWATLLYREEKASTN